MSGNWDKLMNNCNRIYVFSTCNSFFLNDWQHLMNGLVVETKRPYTTTPKSLTITKSISNMSWSQRTRKFQETTIFGRNQDEKRILHDVRLYLSRSNSRCITWSLLSVRLVVWVSLSSWALSFMASSLSRSIFSWTESNQWRESKEEYWSRTVRM